MEPKNPQFQQTKPLNILVVAEIGTVRETAISTSENWMQVTAVDYMGGIKHIHDLLYDGTVIIMPDPNSNGGLSQMLHSNKLVRLAKDRGIPLVVAASRQLNPTIPTSATEIYIDGNPYSAIKTTPTITLSTNTAWKAIYHFLLDIIYRKAKE